MDIQIVSTFQAVTNHAAVSICIHTFTSPKYTPRNGIAGSHGNFNFLRNCQTVSCSSCFL